MTPQLIASSCFFAFILLLTPFKGWSQNPVPLADHGHRFTNSLGMEFVRIDPGTFLMGSENGDLDESPVHLTEIRNPFYMGVFEVTNEQYEQFDPSHKNLRGKLGFSKKDAEAVVYVDWHEARAFTEWLSEKEGLPYRLPTEAEWEYAARAGTTTPYPAGENLPDAFLKNPRESWYPDKDRLHPDDIVDLTVGKTPPNPWGLHEMQGNVEEWTLDWYGPYEYGGRIDPVGRKAGDFKVTRGGSHSTTPYYLRSANRMGTLPDNKHWLIGLRVVMGKMPDADPLPRQTSSNLYRMGVSQKSPDLEKAADPDEPFFEGPRPYIKLNPTENGPFFYHNHQPDITEMPNGDLMAIWYTTKSETGRYLRQAASRLRYGQNEWDPASIFWNVPDRNDHGNALWWDGDETIYHLSGLSAAATWGNLAMILRTSTDNGVTWSPARIINPEHGLRNQVISSMIRTNEGHLIVAADAVSIGQGGTAIHLSKDGGKTWKDPGGTIAGIHASVVQLEDGRLMAFGRGDNIDGQMPKSISDDMGETWTYSASEFPPITSTQRLVLLRMKEGPLFFASFADNMMFEDSSGKMQHGSGLFAAVSYDEGKTWPVKRLIAPEMESANRWMETARGRHFLWTPHTAEPRGYLAGTIAQNGLVHLISTTQHYTFNLKWLETPPERVDEPRLPSKAVLPVQFTGGELPSAASLPGRWVFHGQGAERQIAHITKDAPIALSTTPDYPGIWIDDSDKGFGRADARNGATAEIRLKVHSSESSSRGVDLVVHLGDANKRFYHLTVTADGLYAYDRFSWVPLAQNLDNSSAMHTFRIAVGEDGLARIYRDGKRIALRSPSEYRNSQAVGTGPYLLWGATDPVEAEIEHIGYDFRGGYRPD
ncbi:MAG: SUMF1/EgtB/PvdO family nonheme iron enzyme [Balneolaceae bacterium]